MNTLEILDQKFKDGTISVFDIFGTSSLNDAQKNALGCAYFLCVFKQSQLVSDSESLPTITTTTESISSEATTITENNTEPVDRTPRVQVLREGETDTVFNLDEVLPSDGVKYYAVSVIEFDNELSEQFRPTFTDITGSVVDLVETDSIPFDVSGSDMSVLKNLGTVTIPSNSSNINTKILITYIV